MASVAAEHESGMVAVTAAAAGHQVIKAEFGGKMLAANVLAEGVVVYAGLSSHCAQLVAFCDEFMRRGQVRARATRVAVAGAFHTPMMQVCESTPTHAVPSVEPRITGFVFVCSAPRPSSIPTSNRP